MEAIIQPAVMLLIVAAGYVLKRMGLFRPDDYRVLQTAEFNLVLPGTIIYSFATNEHAVNLLWISAFALLAALTPTLLIYLATVRRPVSDRAFLMLNGSGFNVGCFCFPMLQSLVGPAALVPAAMFDIGNNIMVAAGTNVMTQTFLHIKPGKPLSEQSPGSAPTLPHSKPKDRDVRRLQRRALVGNIAKGFLGSPSFDVYLVMILCMVLDLHLPHWMALVTQPFSAANALCAMLMVGMLMELPDSKGDLLSVLEVLAWRLPCGIVFAASAWFLLPFDPMTRQAVALCCLAPTAVFSTMFTDKVLGNAKLAGFTLALTATIGIVTMTLAHLLMG
ncbi:permease [Bifidobacterium aemilianum]|uniref:Permease n=1 Tax=Bifidobacterium aemilianum TaxID=2493120 RepID=A0A366K6X2_9BIFI|nr:AEC family transporter [Bifidobacterium aemilianum]RBP97429.1 permease [Bifidobacterium aemilianum]